MLANRRAIDPQAKALWDHEITRRVLAFFDETEIPDWGVYWPLAGEPDLHALYQQLGKRGVRLFLPVVLKADAPLGFAAWTPGEPMHKDSKGIAVPEKLRLGQRPELLLIPCLAFNDDKYRLGYGGGFYDRTLAVTEPPLTLGVGYDCMRAQFDGETHDVALDIMITERNTW